MSDPAPLYRLEHLTRYDFGRATRLGPHLLRLRPDPRHHARIDQYSLHLSPSPDRLDWLLDVAGNWVARALFSRSVERLEIRSTFGVSLSERNPFDVLITPEAATLPLRYAAHARAHLAPYLDSAESADGHTAGTGSGQQDAAVQAFANTGPRPEGASLSYLAAMTAHLASTIAYEIRRDEGVLTPAQVWEGKAGSCRDTAWLLIQLLRAQGFAARFVSGYVIDPSPTSLELHAWAEAYLPGAGWIGLDTTSGLLTQNQHIALARASHPSKAAPVEGTREEGPCQIDWHIGLERL